MACNAILGIDDGYHKVGDGGAGGANGGGAASGGKNGAGKSGASGASGATGASTGGTGGTSQGGSSGSSVGAQAGDGEVGGGAQTGAGASGTNARGGSGGNGTGGTGGASPGSGGTAGDAGQAGEVNAPAPMNALVTSTISAYWKTQTWTETTNTPDLTVDDTALAQDWEGFGMTFTEAGADDLLKLSTNERKHALDLLFGADGAHFAWGQIPIGANSYALDRYTEDETGGDLALANFSIERDQSYLIPWIQAAQAVNPKLRFWAAPSTPPTWMKDNSDFDRGNMKGDLDTLDAYANYFVKFIEAYAAEGITIEKVAPQSEPNNLQDSPSCKWTSTLFATFVGKNLGPALASADLDVEIMLGKMSLESTGQDPSIVSAVMGDSTAKQYVKLVGYEWGMLTQMPTTVLYDLPVWQTEHKAGNYPWQPQGYPQYQLTPPNDYAYAVESWGLIRDWIKAGATEYSAWHVMLDSVGLGIDTTRVWAQNSLLYVDVNTSKLVVSPAFHVFRHLSQFVDPGAKVLGTSGSSDALAFKNADGSLVAVVYNAGGAAPYTIAIGGKTLTFDMPGNGWATLKLVN